MAQAPEFKVYNPQGEYVAACKLACDAAAVVAAYGDGATIRHGHRRADTLWTDGVDGEAGESYDRVAHTCHRRLHDMQIRRYAENTGLTEEQVRARIAGDAR